MYHVRFAATFAILVSLATTPFALAQSNTGISNAAPDHHPHVSPSTSELKEPNTNAPGGVTNGPPDPSESSFPKQKKTVKLHSGTNNPTGMTNAAPRAKLKSLPPKKKKTASSTKS
jgi:hypothetical protein